MTKEAWKVVFGSAGYVNEIVMQILEEDGMMHKF